MVIIMVIIINHSRASCHTKIFSEILYQLVSIPFKSERIKSNEKYCPYVCIKIMYVRVNNLLGHGGLMDRMDCQLLMMAFTSFHYR